MKICKANSDGEICNEPVSGGGRCEFHQLPIYGKRHNRESMKSIKARRFNHLKETGKYGRS